MNRLLEDTLSRCRYGWDTELAAGHWMPSVDIYETEQELVLKADLPDVDPKDVDIRIENNTLTIKGERKAQKEVNEENYYRVERSFGSFARSFQLPNTIDADKVKAEFSKGVLKLTMPKREESKPKQIKVSVSQS
jgi:HSP20 family protein